MKELKVMLLIALGVVIVAEPLAARTNRKESSSPSQSLRQSSRAFSGSFERQNRFSQPTQAPRSNFVSPPSMPKSPGSIISPRTEVRQSIPSFFRREAPKENLRFPTRQGNSFFRQEPKTDLRQEKRFPSQEKRFPSLDNRSKLGETLRGEGLRKRLDDWKPRKRPESQPPEERKPAEPRRETREPSREPRKEAPEPRDGYRRPYHYYYYPHRRCLVYPIIWPGYYYPVYYEWGPYWSWYYYWPYYHRRYIFVSLGGWWPCYPCLRYYWYPCHLYYWYGYDPTPCRFGGDTYNYYTYNYYTAECKAPKPKEVPVEPNQPTPADRYFEEGVSAFERQNYPEAICKLEEAMKIAPEDVVLPFSYVQALFANGQYGKATEVLREALSKASPEKEGVFYPRGLYPDENILKEQISQLSRAVRLNPSDADLQLLLGYQLLGIGRFDEAVEPLEKAQQDDKNKQAATLLLDLLDKLKKASPP